MAENKDGQQKSEPASGKRVNEARDRGQVAKSTEITTAAVLFFGGLLTFMFGDQMMKNVAFLMKKTFERAAYIELTTQSVIEYYGKLILFVGQTILPLLSVIACIILAAEISQVGLKFASKKFTQGLNWKSIFNPLSGMKNMIFTSRSVVELLKSVVKLIVLGSLVYQILYSHKDDAVTLLDKPFTEIIPLLVSISLELITKIGLIYFSIAFADFLFQKFKFKSDLKMTKEEVKEEGKQAEGDPKVKSRIRSLMRQKYRKMMMKNVQSADVVITNPTHFAVALKYDTKFRQSPFVVAKGVDFLALNIKEIAKNFNIPIVEDPPLARTLYFNLEVEQEVPEALFKTIAQILAYVYQLKKNAGYQSRYLNKIYQSNL